MMSKDMFIHTQTPVQMSGHSTPSMTPLRSAKRKSNLQKRPRICETKTETSTFFSKSQPAINEGFYDLRTRHVPLYNNSSELFAQYGIYDNFEDPKPKEIKCKKESAAAEQLCTRKHLPKCTSVLQQSCLMVLSAFLGALCYAYFQQHIKLYSSPLQIETEMERWADLKTYSPHLEKVLHLDDEIKNIKDYIRKLQENIGSEVISSPQKGILEELLTADLACAGNLGSVLATPDTTTLTVPATVTLFGVFAFDVDMNYKSPDTTIKGLIQEVGDCWPFEGSRGRLVLKLHRHSLVTGVSISHIPPSISASGDIRSAPRHFQVVTHKKEDDLNDGLTVGEFEYKSSGAWRQSFVLEPLNKNKDLIDIIEFRFLENYGDNYTCVYRVHVHGRILEI